MTDILTSLLPRFKNKKWNFFEHGASICNIMEFTFNMLPVFSLTTVS